MLNPSLPATERAIRRRAVEPGKVVLYVDANRSIHSQIDITHCRPNEVAVADVVRRIVLNVPQVVEWPGTSSDMVQRHHNRVLY